MAQGQAIYFKYLIVYSQETHKFKLYINSSAGLCQCQVTTAENDLYLLFTFIEL